MESQLIPYQATHCIAAKSVVVFAPHPDDEVFGCGGAILRHIAEGHTVEVVIISDGALAAIATSLDRHSLAEIREAESREAGRILGYGEPEFWRLPDRNVQYGEALINRIIAKIDSVSADLIYGPSLLEMHPDHRAIAMSVIEAVRRSHSAPRLAAYEVGVPLSPNLLLDISDLTEHKMAAMACFSSQLSQQRYDLDIAALNRYRSYTLPADVVAAEAYRLISASELADDPFKIYQSEHQRQRALGLELDTTDIPLISVMIRSMDRTYLSEALDSVALQTYGNIEVLVINATGRNHTVLGDSCGRFPLRLVDQGTALSRSQAANAGLTAALGDYLIFLDDDDTFDPYHIAELVRALAQTDLPVVYSGVRIEDEAGHVSGLINYSFNPKRLFISNFLPIHSVLFARQFIHQHAIRFDESLLVYEDWDFWIQFSLLTDFYHIDHISATYRSIGQSGVGLRADANSKTQGREQLLTKWHSRWSGKELNKIAEYTDELIQRSDTIDAQLTSSRQELNDQHILIADMHQQLSEQNQSLEILNQQLSSLSEALHDSNQQLSSLSDALHNSNQSLSTLHQDLADRDAVIQALYHSTSWRITSPLRLISAKLRNLRTLGRVLRIVGQEQGGVIGLAGQVIRVYRSSGWQSVKDKVSRRLANLAHSPQDLIDRHQRNDYSQWIVDYDTLNDSQRSHIREWCERLKNPPLLSVVMPTYNPDLVWLEAAFASVKNQLYPHWELCVADDASTHPEVKAFLSAYAQQEPRLKCVFRPENGHISEASNSAIAISSGSWMVLMDQDDLLSEDALFQVARAIQTYPDAGIIYSDEDKIDESGLRKDPYFKTDWNLDLFRSQNMISHLGAYRLDLVRESGGFRKGFEGSQDYDLALRCTEKLQASQIIHIPKVLYHWRIHSNSTAHSLDSKPYALEVGKKALAEHLARTGVSADVEILPFSMYRVRYHLPRVAPKVSIIIPTRNRQDLLHLCIDSILTKTTYPDYEIIVMDNGSDEAETLAYLESLRTLANVRVIRDDSPFNYSALNNKAAAIAKGTVLCLLNNDIEVISPDWLEEMVAVLMQDNAGIVGAKLYYPDNTLQHAGVILGVGGVANHAFKSAPRDQLLYFGRSHLMQSLSAVTGACLLIKKAVFDSVGGLNAEDLAVAFNDVDLCLKVRQAGYRIVWTPFAELYHHESVSRGQEDTPEKWQRFIQEVNYMEKTWEGLLLQDPAYNPNLTLQAEDFSLAWPPRSHPFSFNAFASL